MKITFSQKDFLYDSETDKFGDLDHTQVEERGEKAINLGTCYESCCRQIIIEGVELEREIR